MKKLSGIQISKGKAIGKIVILSTEDIHYSRIALKSEHLDAEKQRLQNALIEAKKEVHRLIDTSISLSQTEQTQILESYIIMLQDIVVFNEVEQYMEKELVSLESSLSYICDTYVEKMLAIPDPYFQARADDFKQVFRMLFSALKNEANQPIEQNEDFILVAKEIGPADMAKIDKKYLKGFILEQGNKTSHAAIVSRSMGIPMIVGVQNIKTTFVDGNLCVLDGDEGFIYLSPSKEILEKVNSAINYEKEQIQREKELLDTEAITQSGTKISLLANIGTVEEVEEVLLHNADGIGLFRTEFLFMQNGGSTLPTEEEQFTAYKTVLEKISPKPVVFRTLDAGGDKHIAALNIPQEENPYLGLRAIRYCLKEQSVFKTQIRALLRASAFGNAKIMLPMIISKEEIIDATKIIDCAREELEKEGVTVTKVPVGIMIETPAAAINAKELSTVADFFSIGTNDLTQYTLAVDRGNANIAELYNEAHPAVISLISYVITTAKSSSLPVSLCGEMAGNTEFTEQLLQAGLTDFSMSPINILKVKKIIRNYI